MSSIAFSCPDCRARLKFSARLPVGKQVQCPECAAVFPLPAPDAGPGEVSWGWADQGRQAATAVDGDAITPAGGPDADVEPPRPRRPRSGWRVLVGVLVGIVVVIAVVCGGLMGLVHWLTGPTNFPPQDKDYRTARAEFQTRLPSPGPSPQPWDRLVRPRDVREVRYASGNLSLVAWLSEPRGGGRHPAVLYVHNGCAFGNDDWEQTAPFRHSGFVVLAPMLRGENAQRGAFSLCYDEVDDVLAAADALARVRSVDPKRIYVAGHWSGGTIALLAAMASPRFKAAASFSGWPDMGAAVHWADRPVPVAPRYETWPAPFDVRDVQELKMRSPLAFARSFKCPARLYYGDQEFFIQMATEKTASLAQGRGLDVRAELVPGNEVSAVRAALPRCVRFFQEQR